MRRVIAEKGLDQLANAQLGMLEITLAELIVTEVDLDADFDESLPLLRSWTPIHPNSPSQKESMALGILSQMLGKILKDKGEFPESAAELTHYLDAYAVPGSQNQGWATGDYAQVLMEMGQVDQAEETLLALLRKRPSYSDPEEKAKDRRSDIMFIDIQYGECLHLRRRFQEAEEKLLELRVKFQRFGELWDFEKTRVFFILSALARTAEGEKQFSKALLYWQEALNYAITSMNRGHQVGKWERDTFLVSVVIYSLADCYYELGNLEQARALRKEAEETQRVHQRMCWMMGLGTYWLAELKRRMSERGELSE